MAVNKVTINDEVQLDLTGDTVTPETLFEGVTAHDKSGEPIVGTYVAFEATIVVTVESGAVVKLQRGDETLQTATSSGTVTFKVRAKGTYTVVAELYGVGKSKDVAVEADTTYEISLDFASNVLNDTTWATIKSVSDNGLGANYWSIGDCKAVTLNGTVGSLTLSNFATYAFILGFNHNAEVEGNGIHFQLAKTALTGGKAIAFVDAHYGSTSTEEAFRMNGTATNAGGWGACTMRTKICGTDLSNYDGTMISILPQELRGVLRPVKKYTAVNTADGTDPTAPTETEDIIFLLSEFEVFGAIAKGHSTEQTKQKQYDYYAAGNGKGKYKHDAQEMAAYWWLRSPYASNTREFVIVNQSGAAYDYSASLSRGFAPAFCV